MNTLPEVCHFTMETKRGGEGKLSKKCNAVLCPKMPNLTSYLSRLCIFGTEFATIMSHFPLRSDMCSTRSCHEGSLKLSSPLKHQQNLYHLQVTELRKCLWPIWAQTSVFFLDLQQILFHFTCSIQDWINRILA